MNKGIEKALQQLGISYDVYGYQFTDWEKDESFQEKFRATLTDKTYTDVLSVNYAPLISEICEELSIPYTSWVYDSPLQIKNQKSLSNSCNRIFFFDREQAKQYKKSGINAYHMPLAVDTDAFRITGSGEKYKADISLVGKLYQTEYKFFSAPLEEYDKGYLEGIINSQLKLYGGYIIPDMVTDELLDRMNTTYARVATDGFQMGKRELEFMLACETTGRERHMALALLSGHYNVDLYSTDKDEKLPNVRYRGYADYYTQMPYIFSNSRINLNISLKTIQTGIPLRVIDVIGCGGFLISNYQEEIVEYLDVGKECIVYENIEDLYFKVKYYLEHEEQRKMIAQAGYECAKRDFTFKNRIERIFKIH